MIAILTYDKAKGRIGYNLNDKGYLLMWSSLIKGNYEHIVSWELFTKKQALDTIMLIIMIARILPENA